MAVSEKLAAAYIEITARLSKFNKGLGEAQRKLGGALKRMSARLNAFAARTEAMSRRARRAFLAVGAGIVAAGYITAKFEKQMGMVSTMLDGDVGPAMTRFRRQLKSMSVEFGQSTDTLSKGLYDILSASIGADKAIKVLEVGTKAAVGGFTDAATSIDAITTMLNAYGLSAEHAGDMADWLAAIVKGGKLTYAELASNIGKVASTAKLAGLSLNELGAMMRLVTRRGIKSEEAVTAINAVLMAFLKPQEAAVKVAKKYGFVLEAATLRAKGLAGVLQLLTRASEADIAAIAGSSRAIKALASATLDAEGYTRDLAAMADRAGMSMRAFELASADMAYQFGRVKSAAALAADEFFRVIVGASEGESGLKKMADALESVAGWFRNLSAPIRTAIRLFGKAAVAGLALAGVISIVARAAGVLSIAVIKVGKAMKWLAVTPWGRAIVVAGVLAAAIIGFSGALSSSTRAILKNADAMEAEARAAEKVVDEFRRLETERDKLIAQGKDVNTVQEKMNELGRKLTEAYGPLPGLFDKFGQALNLTAEAMAKLNKVQRDALELAALKRLSEHTDKQRELTKALRESEKAHGSLADTIAKTEAATAALPRERKYMRAPIVGEAINMLIKEMALPQERIDELIKEYGLSAGRPLSGDPVLVTTEGLEQALALYEKLSSRAKEEIKFRNYSVQAAKKAIAAQGVAIKQAEEAIRLVKLRRAEKAKEKAGKSPFAQAGEGPGGKPVVTGGAAEAGELDPSQLEIDRLRAVGKARDADLHALWKWWADKEALVKQKATQAQWDEYWQQKTVAGKLKYLRAQGLDETASLAEIYYARRAKLQKKHDDALLAATKAAEDKRLGARKKSADAAERLERFRRAGKTAALRLQELTDPRAAARKRVRLGMQDELREARREFEALTPAQQKQERASYQARGRDIRMRASEKVRQLDKQEAAEAKGREIGGRIGGLQKRLKGMRGMPDVAGAWKTAQSVRDARAMMAGKYKGPLSKKKDPAQRTAQRTAEGIEKQIEILREIKEGLEGGAILG